jgi:hypothetical protein
MYARSYGWCVCGGGGAQTTPRVFTSPFTWPGDWHSVGDSHGRRPRRRPTGGDDCHLLRPDRARVCLRACVRVRVCVCACV